MKLRPRRARFSSRRYINLVAKHHLVDRLQAQSRAFVRGLAEVVDPKWLRMFNEPELQVRASRRSRARARAALDARRPDPPPPAHPRYRRKVLISGVRARLDVDDLRKHARYSGGYTPLDKTVRRFWKVLETLEAEDGEKFLRFVKKRTTPPVFVPTEYVTPFGSSVTLLPIQLHALCLKPHSRISGVVGDGKGAMDLVVYEREPGCGAPAEGGEALSSGVTSSEAPPCCPVEISSTAATVCCSAVESLAASTRMRYGLPLTG